MSKQLAERTDNGVYVELKWLPIMDAVVIYARNEESGESLATLVDPRLALDAFYHPACYLPCPEVIFA